MAILVLGGAGYIGSHMVDTLLSDGRDVVVVDNLLTGHRAAVPAGVPFYEVDIRDKAALREVFEKENIEQVVHFAASSIVPESMADPLKYFDNNTAGMIALLEVMLEFDVKQIVFSSTAATYGIPEENPIKETTPQNPINPYGESKLQMEHIMKWGDDYNTPDGFNVRDYVHVMDLANAHVLALDYLAKGNDSNQFNLGSANGFSVKQMVEAAREATGKEIPAEVGPRRAGDPDSLVASSDKAREILGWAPKYDDVKEIIKTAWTWHQKHPNGYEDR